MMVPTISKWALDFRFLPNYIHVDLKALNERLGLLIIEGFFL